MTPLFSYLLSRLFYEVSNGARNVSIINIYGASFSRSPPPMAFSSDKKWFDKTENSPARLVQILIKDGDDARALIASVLCQCLVVVAMLGVGLIWALVRGWQLTLVGFAIAPVFAATMALQSHLVSKCEVRNKRAREEVAKQYYDAISNVRAIRAMGFEDAFRERFDVAVESAMTTGVRGAFVEGCTYGVASALIYFAEALLFYVGAVLIANGTYSYLQMIQTLQLVVFSVSIGSQLMSFTHRIAKSLRATRDFHRLMKLSTLTDESRGILRPQIAGNVAFENVTFSYPERPDVPVLKDLSVEIAENECVAVVGSSGCGKSTIAALLQRLASVAQKLNIPRRLARPAFAEPSRDAVARIDPSLAGVPLEYIRRTLAGNANQMLTALSLLAVPSSLPCAHLPPTIDAPVRPSSQTPDLSAFPTHVLAILSSRSSATTPTMASFADRSSLPASTTVPLYPASALVLAAHCALLPPLPQGLPPNGRRAALTLPIVPLTIPNPEAFPLLHAYLHNAVFDLAPLVHAVPLTYRLHTA
ncbi:hypothetical protein NUW54_g11964 [Trametes sanguinea]|uniref:Uncharacterized protein n=1 Tax=Trametes sanguinea TaxID=158606 RepID=A0ACC1N4S6_9APHY|nr:hypothetical protein NUW54_g11964 [Trametes sanguinea]